MEKMADKKYRLNRSFTNRNSKFKKDNKFKEEVKRIPPSMFNEEFIHNFEHLKLGKGDSSNYEHIFEDIEIEKFVELTP